MTELLTKDEITRVLALYSPSDTGDIKLVLKALHHLTNGEILLACRAYNNTGLMFATYKNIDIQNDHENNYRRIIIHNCPYTYTFDNSTGNIGLFKSGKQVFAECSPAALIQHYLQSNVAIPLFFGHGHEANGKTAIELGIAEPSLELLTALLERKLQNWEAVNHWFFDQKLMGNDLTKLEMVDTFIKELSNE